MQHTQSTTTVSQANPANPLTQGPRKDSERAANLSELHVGSWPKEVREVREVREEEGSRQSSGKSEAVEKVEGNGMVRKQEGKVAGECVGDYQTEGGSKPQQSGQQAASQKYCQPISNPDSVSSQHCFNRLCQSVSNLRPIRSRLQNAQINLCRQCYSNFSAGLHCTLCQQIYSRTGPDDGQQWVQCQQCQRKNHLECERRANSLSLIKGRYVCGVCEGKKRRRRNQRNYQSKEVKKEPIPEEERVNIFSKTACNYQFLDAFLNGFSYKLALSEEEVVKDLAVLARKKEKGENQGEGVAGSSGLKKRRK